MEVTLIPLHVVVFLTILAALPPLPFLAKTLEKNHLGVFSPIFEKRLDLAGDIAT